MAGILVALGLVVPLTPAANEDLAWLSYAAGRYLDGATLYADLIELNPPAIVFFNLPAAWIAEVFGVPRIPTFTIYVALVAIVSIAASSRLLRSLEAVGRTDRRLLVLLLVGVLFTLSGRNFGQREHLILILLLPYVSAAVVRLGGARPSLQQAIGVGLVAAVGLAFKPHFLAVWLAVEGVLWWRRSDRSAVFLRPENWTIAASLLIYLGSVVVLTPEYFSLVRVYGDAYVGYLAVPPGELLTHPAMIFSATALVGLVTVGLRTAWEPVGRAWAAVVVGCVFGAVAQLKGWSYHYFPAFAASMVLLGLVSIRGRSGFRFQPSGVARTVCLSVFLLGVLAGITSIGPIRRESQQRLDRLRSVAAHVEARCDPGPRITIFSPDADAAFPMVTRFGYEWGLRFPTMQLLSAVYEEQARRGARIRWRDISEASAAERFTIEAVVEDVTGDPPDLMMVERRDSRRAFGHSGFGYVEYFSRDERFRSLMSEYRLLGHWSGYRVWGYENSTVCFRTRAGA